MCIRDSDIAVGAIERDDKITKLLDPGVHGGLPTKACAPCRFGPFGTLLECSDARIDTCALRKATPGPTCSVALCRTPLAVAPLQSAPMHLRDLSRDRHFRHGASDMLAFGPGLAAWGLVTGVALSLIHISEPT